MKYLFVSGSIFKYIQFFDELGPIGKPVDGFSASQIPDAATRFRRFKKAHADISFGFGRELFQLKSEPRWQSPGFIYPGAKYATLDELDQSKESPAYKQILRTKLASHKNAH